MGADAKKIKTMAIYNSNDILMPPVELTSESGDYYTMSRGTHLGLLRSSVRYMTERDMSFLLKLPRESKRFIQGVR